MEKQTFVATAGKRVGNLARTYGLSENRAFLVWAASLLWGLEEEDALEAIMDRPNDKRVDLFWFDEAGERILVAQGKYSQGAKNPPRLRELNAFPSCLTWLVQPEALAREGLPDLADAAKQFLELRERDLPVELWFVYFAEPDKNLEKEVAIFNQDPRNQGERVYLRLVSLENLRVQFEEQENVAERVSRDVLPVRWAQPQTGIYGKALVGTVKGQALALLYERHGDKLFARNVRLFLRERKGSVNQGIATTLRDPADSGNFWAYNNGVTIVCQDFDYDQ